MKKRTWYYCDGGCGTVLENELRVGGCGICRDGGTMRYLALTEEEYAKYGPFMEEIGVIEFAHSLPDSRPLRKHVIEEWEKEKGI